MEIRVSLSLPYTEKPPRIDVPSKMRPTQADIVLFFLFKKTYRYRWFTISINVCLQPTIYDYHTNIDVSDGLSNGAVGKLVHLEHDENDELSRV